MVIGANTDLTSALDRIRDIPDPELPFVTLGDLGVIRSLEQLTDGTVEVVITPTFLGCPALPSIDNALRDVLRACGHREVRVHHALAPAWTSDSITDAGRRKLTEHAIVPPDRTSPQTIGVPLAPRCPTCGSVATRPVSEFGATRCQSILLCLACNESFAQMKTL